MIFEKTSLDSLIIVCKNCLWSGKFSALRTNNVEAELWGNQKTTQKVKTLEFYCCPKCDKSVAFQQSNEATFISLMRVEIK